MESVGALVQLLELELDRGLRTIHCRKYPQRHHLLCLRFCLPSTSTGPCTLTSPSNSTSLSTITSTSPSTCTSPNPSTSISTSPCTSSSPRPSPSTNIGSTLSASLLLHGILLVHGIAKGLFATSVCGSANCPLDRRQCKVLWELL